MKTKLFLITFLMSVFFTINSLFAQDNQNNTSLFLIHQDQVHPYMSEKYESALKNFRDLLAKNNVDEMSFTVAQQEYFTYSAVIPVNDYNGLAKHFGMSGEMISKIGKENFSNAMKMFDGCYDNHKNFILRLRNDLSYIPKYGLDPKEGLNFRHLDYLHIIPGKEDKMLEVLKEWKDLYAKHNIKNGYRVYLGDLGTDTPMVLFVGHFKDRASWVLESGKIAEILGDEQKTLLKKTFSIMQKFEHKNGTMRPDLAYTKSK
ncbi:hypothetical protein BMS3Abin04_01887 [bacterium BMS3Abin04]|nr:hypothetical protein BMS3Abin04_01887 [bacterium BMS3Abin04]